LLLRYTEPAWVPLKAQVFTGSQQVLANTDRLGVFVAAASVNSGGASPRTAGTTVLGGIAAVAGLIVAMVARDR
jgi:hypothetical protein